jgi:hypothetical protein
MRLLRTRQRLFLGRALRSGSADEVAYVKDRIKQGDGVFESGLGNRRQIAQILVSTC